MQQAQAEKMMMPGALPHAHAGLVGLVVLAHEAAVLVQCSRVECPEEDMYMKLQH